MSDRKTTVVSWDASFRESYHWFDSMAVQNEEAVDFVWVDYYSATDVARDWAIQDERFSALSLDSDRNAPWHLGKCINHGVRSLDSDWLLLTDGDIIVREDFISSIFEKHDPRQDDVIYFRRFDELESSDKLEAWTDIDELATRCVLNNPTNFGACAFLHRSQFCAVGGYEEHDTFCGPGIASLEFNVRLRNSGASIRWSDLATYHPWHANTGEPHDKAVLLELEEKRSRYPWLNPYAGVRQSWIVHCRSLEIDVIASVDTCEKYLAALPSELQAYS